MRIYLPEKVIFTEAARHLTYAGGGGGQTLWAQIRLLLQVQSDLDSH